jgi:hypothetical protein
MVSEPAIVKTATIPFTRLTIEGYAGCRNWSAESLASCAKTMSLYSLPTLCDEKNH